MQKLKSPPINTPYLQPLLTTPINIVWPSYVIELKQLFFLSYLQDH